MPKRNVDLPLVFGDHARKVSYVQQWSTKEFSSTCPQCGGTVHSDGSWPDRCRWFLDDHPCGWCRRCSALYFADSAKRSMSPAEFESWRKDQVEREEARKHSAERALEFLRSQQLWTRYYEARGEAGTTYWRNRGVPDNWQDFWQLGFCPGHSATIPLFDPGWQVLNIKHRMLTTNDAGMKYRYEITGQGQPVFLCNPSAQLTGPVIAIEGEIKAMVTAARLDDDTQTIVGLPGSTPSAQALATIGNASDVLLVLDPGAEIAARNIADKLGKARCRILIPHTKIDDAILATDATKWDVRRWLRQARKAC